jgi:LysM repeat protein
MNVCLNEKTIGTIWERVGERGAVSQDAKQRAALPSREEELLVELTRSMEALQAKLASNNNESQLVQELKKETGQLQTDIANIKSQIDALNKNLSVSEQGNASSTEGKRDSRVPDKVASPPLDNPVNQEPPKQTEGTQVGDNKLSEYINKLSEYIVRSGETLDSIARVKCISVAEILGLNRLKNADQIRVGQKILLREGACTVQ